MGKRNFNNPSEMIGRKYGMLFVVEDAGRNKGKKVVKCVCDCGNETVVRVEYLVSGHTKSCGCHRKSALRLSRTKHGMYQSRLYRIWNSMLNRCRDSNGKSYSDYGGRGIKVCSEWESSFEAFRDWAMANGYRDDLTLDREDTNGDYSPDNCRWATRIEQANNKRNNLLLEARGETHTAAEWSRITGTNHGTILSRKSYGWSDEEAIFGKSL